MSLQRLVVKNVKQRRKQAGLTQEELAKRCRMTRRYIVGIEAGSGVNLTLHSLERLAVALNCMVVDLLSDPEHDGKLPKRVRVGLDFAIQALQTIRKRCN